MPFAPHDFLNFDFWCCVGGGRVGGPTGVPGGITGVVVPEVDVGAVGAPRLLLTAVDDTVADGEREDDGDGEAPPDRVGTESTDSERDVLARFGNIAGIRKPGERGFTA